MSEHLLKQAEQRIEQLSVDNRSKIWEIERLKSQVKQLEQRILNLAGAESTDAGQAYVSFLKKQSSKR